MLNQHNIIGRVGQDPKFHRFENGNSVVKISVATSERFQDKDGEWQEKTEWHEAVAWGKRAEWIAEKVKKGETVLVSGKMQYRDSKDENGKTKWRYAEINIATIKRIVKKDQASHMPGPENEPVAATTANTVARADNGTSTPPPVNDLADDLPF